MWVSSVVVWFSPVFSYFVIFAMRFFSSLKYKWWCWCYTKKNINHKMFCILHMMSQWYSTIKRDIWMMINKRKKRKKRLDNNNNYSIRKSFNRICLRYSIIFFVFMWVYLAIWWCLKFFINLFCHQQTTQTTETNDLCIWWLSLKCLQNTHKHIFFPASSDPFYI